MSNLDQLIERLSGGDPITGAQALHELLALGDAGEEALFSRPIEFPGTVQARRRWLQYVASRERTVVDRLVDRMQNQDRFKDAYTVAYLFAGIGENREAINALYAQLETGFEQGQPTDATLYDYSGVAYRFLAWGYAGGNASTLWHYVRGSHFAWEKLATFAFRGACKAVARVRASDCWAIEQLITHEWQDFGLVKISDSPETRISHQAIASYEFSLPTNDVFLTWRRGEVADEILRSWSQHAHWRVRDFGAQVLANLGFRRIVKPLIKWLREEPVQTVRTSLLDALERSETVQGANALIEHFNSSSQEARPYLVKVAWRADDKNRALTALNAVADGKDDVAAEALVSLARLGHRHVQLNEALESRDHYTRLNAALAVAYLGDKSALELLLAMVQEAARPIERLYILAALAIIGNPNAAAELHQALIAAAGLKDLRERVDLFFVHRFLQAAVIDGLAAGGLQTSEFLNVWRAELEPLEPIPNAIVPAISNPATTDSKQSSMLSPQSQGHGQSVGRASEPLSVQDKNQLITILTAQATTAQDGPEKYFRNLVQRIDLPPGWKDERIGGWTGDANHDALELIEWAIKKGKNPKNNKYMALGALLEVVYEAVGVDERQILYQLIVHYNLIMDQAALEALLKHDV